MSLRISYERVLENTLLASMQNKHFKTSQNPRTLNEVSLKIKALAKSSKLAQETSSCSVLVKTLLHASTLKKPWLLKTVPKNSPT